MMDSYFEFLYSGLPAMGFEQEKIGTDVLYKYRLGISQSVFVYRKNSSDMGILNDHLSGTGFDV